MQIHLEKKETNIYKYILHVFLLVHTPRNVWRSSHVLAGISMFFLKNLFLFFVVGYQSLVDVLIKRDTMKQNVQGNILKDFPLICLNVSDFSLLFNCIFLFRRQQIFCPSSKPYPVSTKATLSLYFCFALVYLLTFNITVPRFPVDYE